MSNLSYGHINAFALAVVLGCAGGCFQADDDGYATLDAGAEGAASALLSWDPTTARTDGVEIAELPMYRIYLAKRSRFDEEGPRTYDRMIEVGTGTCERAGRCEATVGDLRSGTYYFAVTALVEGRESAFSNEESKNVSGTERELLSTGAQQATLTVLARAPAMHRSLDVDRNPDPESWERVTSESARSSTPRPNPPTGLQVE